MTIGLPHKMGSAKAACSGVAIGCLLLLGACSSLPFSEKVDATSAAAGSVTRVERMDLPYPRWSQFPATPRNIPTPVSFAGEAKGVEAAQVELLSEASGLQWTLCCTEEWAAQARAAIDPALATPAPPNAEADMEAFARAAREQATPPPPAPK